MLTDNLKSTPSNLTDIYSFVFLCLFKTTWKLDCVIISCFVLALCFFFFFYFC